MINADADLCGEIKKRLENIRKMAVALVKGTPKAEDDFEEEVWQEMAKTARGLEANAQLLAIHLEEGIRRSVHSEKV